MPLRPWSSLESNQALQVFSPALELRVSFRTRMSAVNRSGEELWDLNPLPGWIWPRRATRFIQQK